MWENNIKVLPKFENTIPIVHPLREVNLYSSSVKVERMSVSLSKHQSSNAWEHVISRAAVVTVNASIGGGIFSTVFR